MIEGYVFLASPIDTIVIYLQQGGPLCSLLAPLLRASVELLFVSLIFDRIWRNDLRSTCFVSELLNLRISKTLAENKPYKCARISMFDKILFYGYWVFLFFYFTKQQPIIWYLPITQTNRNNAVVICSWMQEDDFLAKLGGYLDSSFSFVSPLIFS